MPPGKNVRVLMHPLVQHKLSLMRQKATPSHEFRRLLREISMYFAYELTIDLPIIHEPIETPVATMSAPTVDMKSLSIVSILRAGNGIVEGLLEALPTATVGHIGLYRDPESLRPVEYYCKLPKNIPGGTTIVADPMLATGYSAAAAIALVKREQPARILFISLLSAPEGLEVLCNAHPDIEVATAAVDERLNEHGYIVPGLGDAGDRIYGTR